MTAQRHTARCLEFKELLEGLIEARDKRIVSEKEGPRGLRLYGYTNQCVYDRLWDRFSLLARGLILDVEQGRVVATPFPKFFNVGEMGLEVPDRPFETFEKVDGSLIILFWHEGDWRTATKGSFDSEQALWAHAQLARCDATRLVKGTTYLLEAVYAENKLVVRYDEEELVLLAAYDEAGHEAAYDQLLETGGQMGWRVAGRHSYGAVSELLAKANGLPATEEGYVLRFEDGYRLKIKGAEYCRIHALISRVTPLAIWEAVEASDDLDEIRQHLPEEFWDDFDQIRLLTESRLETMLAETTKYAAQTQHMSDKEVGLSLGTFPPDVRRLIFPYRKTGGDLMGHAKTRHSIFRAIRPTSNVLPGYVPSYGLNRVQEDFG